MRSRIYQRGKKWYIDYEGPDGRRIRQKVGNKQTAENALAAIRADILRGEYRFVEDAKLRFKDFKAEYLEYVKGKKNKFGMSRVWRRHEISLGHLEAYFGEMLLSKIGDEEIEKYRKLRAETVYYRNEEKGIEKRIDGGTINRELACLRHFFNVAKKKKKFFGDNPVNKEDHFLEEHPRQGRALTRMEITRLLDAAKKESPRLALAVTLALCTGLRKSEILGIKWANVDFDERSPSIWIEKTKGGKPHRAYMNKVAYAALKAAPQEGEYVFHSPSSKTSHAIDLKRAWKRVKKAAGLASARFHDLRTSVGTHQADMGVPAVGIQGTLGHASLTTTERHYIKFLDEAGRQAAAALESLFEEGPKNPDTSGAQVVELKDVNHSFSAVKPGRA